MAKLSAHDVELYRALSPRRGALLSVRGDGVTLYRTPWTTGWKVLSRKKAEVSIDDWKASKRKWYDSLPAWAKVQSVPSIATLERWNDDGICQTVDGQRIEPDGVAANGAPSWLRFFGMI